MYLFGPEICEYRSLRIFNDYNDADATCLILDSANFENITSAFVTVTNTPGVHQSFNQSAFYTCDFRKNVIGPAMIVRGNVHQLKFYDGYMAAYQGVCIKTDRSYYCSDWLLDVHFETDQAPGLEYCVEFDTTTVGQAAVFRGFHLRDLSPHCKTAIFKTTGVGYNLVLLGLDVYIGQILHQVPLFDNNGGTRIVEGRIDWCSTSKYLDLSNINFNGKIFKYSTQNMVHTVGSYQLVDEPVSSNTRDRIVTGKQIGRAHV